MNGGSKGGVVEHVAPPFGRGSMFEKLGFGKTGDVGLYSVHVQLEG
jgi:hypothetical protein